MTLAERCASCFQPEVWTRGLILYQQGRVALAFMNDAGVRATVQPSSGSPVQVGLDVHLGSSAIEVRCTCQDYGTGNLCHHIWAALLSADEASWLHETLPQLEELTIRHQDDLMGRPAPNITDDANLWNSLFGASRRVARGRVIPLSRRRDRKPSTPQPPTWHDHVHRILRHTTHQLRRTGQGLPRAQTRPRRAWYVWNVSKSLQAGGLVLDYYHQDRRQTGAFGKLKPQGVSRDDLILYEDPADQRLLQLLLGHPSEGESGSAAPSPAQPPPRRSACMVAPILYDLLLPELCATGRLIWTPDASADLDEAEPLEWDAGEPWRFKLRVVSDTSDESWRVQGQLVRGDQTTPLSDPRTPLGRGAGFVSWTRRPLGGPGRFWLDCDPAPGGGDSYSLR